MSETFKNIEQDLHDIWSIRETCSVWCEIFDWAHIWISVSFEVVIRGFPQKLEACFYLEEYKKAYLSYYKPDEEDLDYRQIQWFKTEEECIRRAKQFNMLKI